MDAEFAFVAAHSGFGGDHFGKRLDRYLRLGLLEKTDNGVDEHDAENNGGVHPLTEKRGDAAGEQENVNKRLVELLKELHPRRRATARGDAVRAELLLAAADFIRRQAGGKIHAEEFNNLLGRQFVPVFIF